MSTSVLRNLIVYLVRQLTDMEAEFAKTKLVKLLYLADVEGYRAYGRTLSGLEWRFYHYGPYARDIDVALRQLDLDIPQEEILTEAGRRAIVFKTPRDALTDWEERIPNREKLILDSVLTRWGLEELNPILDYVYFHTEPMIQARRGEVLDFSAIQRRLPQARRQHRGELPPEKLEPLRTRFQQLRVGRSQLAREALKPKPRLDDLYEKIVVRMEEEERYRLPAGEIRLDDDAKHQLRDLGE